MFGQAQELTIMKVDITTSHQPGAPGKVDATRNKESERAQQTPKPGGDRALNRK